MAGAAIFLLLICVFSIAQAESQSVNINLIKHNLVKRYVPNNSQNVVVVNEEKLKTQIIILTTKGEKNLKLNKLTISKDKFLKTLPTPSTPVSLKKQAIRGYSDWTDFSCCRRNRGAQIRVRVFTRNPRFSYAALQSRRCNSNYCRDCEDAFPFDCRDFSLRYGFCRASSPYASFMSTYCPVTCGLCTNVIFRPPPPPTTTTPPPTTATTTIPITTTSPFITSATGLVRLNVYYIDVSPNRRVYRYETNDRSVPSPWIPGFLSDDPKELFSILMFRSPYGEYNQPIYFCSHRSTLGMRVANRPCLTEGWDSEFQLYASFRQLNDAEFIINSGTSERPQATRLHRGSFCCGYTSNAWAFYVPTTSPPITTTRPTIPPIFTSRPPFTTRTRPFFTVRPTTSRPFFTVRPTTSRPFFTVRPTTTRPFFTVRPTTTRPFFTVRPTTSRPFFTVRPTTPLPTRPPFSTSFPTGPQPQSAFGRACLETHNFFRAVHNTAPLQWDPQLAGTAQAWANFLLRVAPNSPNDASPQVRTPAWPHSQSGSVYRGQNVGENIAWSLSSSGETGETSALRWYAEVFDYNRNNPTQSSSGRPTGHYTQMLWADSNRLGCSSAVGPGNFNRFPLQSTYTVAHYGPAGNFRLPTQAGTVREYNENVREARQGSCSSTCSRGNENNCMGYDSSFQCTCGASFGGQGGALCRGSGGCIARCTQSNQNSGRFISECRGESSCQCTTQPVNNEIGAICD